MTLDQLTPEDRELAQLALLRIWLARKVPKGTKRKSDRVGPVKRYDSQGKPIA